MPAPSTIGTIEMVASVMRLAAKNWAELKVSCQRSLAINPFLKQPHECLAAAADAENDHAGAIAALRHLLVLGPDDPVDVNYRLARLLLEQDRSRGTQLQSHCNQRQYRGQQNEHQHGE